MKYWSDKFRLWYESVPFCLPGLFMWINLFYQTAILPTANSTRLWEQWWTYRGVSGPDVWGTHKDKWVLCKIGKYQSPIDVSPDHLIFDPNLTTLKFDKNLHINGVLINTGQDLTYEIDDDPEMPSFIFSGGPMSYSYQACHVKLHFGTNDSKGSEHLIGGKQFPLELQIVGFNKDLYRNFSEALTSTHGVAIISILGAIDDSISFEFDKIVSSAKKIRYKGMQNEIIGISLGEIIPPAEFYITYEGSITYPSCQETVTWVIINKPLYLTKDQMAALRELNRWGPVEEFDKEPLIENNFRPPKPINKRPVRTNIRPVKDPNEECLTTISKSYKDTHSGATIDSVHIKCPNQNNAVEPKTVSPWRPLTSI